MTNIKFIIIIIIIIISINYILFYLCEELIAWMYIVYELNLLDITIKYRIVAIFVTVDLQATLQPQCTHILMCQLPKCHTLSLNVSLLIAVIPN
jgi:hypothetical protein